jgi:hypothetical protein
MFAARPGCFTHVSNLIQDPQRGAHLACDRRCAIPLATLGSSLDAGESGGPLEFHVFAGGVSGCIGNKTIASPLEGSASIRTWNEGGLDHLRHFRLAR